MSDTIRTAADRLRRYYAGDETAYSRREGPGPFTGDVLRVVAAYFAECPDDDAEPVTEERLRAMPGCVPDSGLFIWGRGRLWSGPRVAYGPRFLTAGEPMWSYQDGAGGRAELPAPATMGDVRRLLAALGLARPLPVAHDFPEAAKPTPA